jgi:transposase
MHHQESCRWGITAGSAKESIKEVLELLKTQIEKIKAEIMKIIDSNAGLKEKYDILNSMKGVGPMLAMKLITDLPELGNANKKEIAALVGVAPITNESGKRKGKEATKYGRFGVRKILYMGALVASQHNPTLKAFYKKLITKGKAPKVALVAVMRKMVVILNAMIQSRKHFYA